MENLEFGLAITLYGMGLVFTLLTLLWGLLALVGRLDRAAVQEGAGGDASHRSSVDAGGAPLVRFKVADAIDLEPEVIAAITIAVVAHTSARRRQAAPAMRSAKPGSQLWASRWLAAGRTRQTRGYVPPKR
jgi:Na+-transporting methylmalonyl-CoA/oxaloacetate decarboxylase gamma subunit